MPAVTHRGLENLVVAETRKSKVEGIEGRLSYSGYRIEDLAQHATFEEIIWLLWNNELPTSEELETITATLAAEREIPDAVHGILRALPKDTHPMAALRTGVSALGAFDPDAELAPDDEDARRRSVVRLVAQIPTIAAVFERVRSDMAPIPPRSDLGHSANLLYMLSGVEAGPAAVRALDVYLILLADHGFNASTFSGRVTAATKSDPYSAITSAIGTLKGPLHGGANQRVMEMLESIGSVDAAVPWVMDKIAKGERIMGIGHRVYKTLDPRAAILRKMSEAQAVETGNRTYHDIAVAVADTTVDYFAEHRPELKLNPNVDFYSAAVLYGAGVSTDQFTPLFAVSRVAGWTAHLLEQYADNRLIRPRAEYAGAQERDYVPIDAR